MGNQKVSQSRRALLNGTLGLGALGAIAPNSWTKPIVNVVVLPAHADMSPIPSFSVEKTQSGGPSPAMVVDAVIEYEIVVTNTGNVDLTNVVATDTMPDGSVVVLSGQTESITSDGVLEVAETWTYTTSYTVTQSDIDAGSALTNSVSVVVDEVSDPQVDDVDTPVVSGTGSFTVEKIQSGGANPVSLVGDVIEYTIVVTNTGDISLTGLVATDTMPDGSVVVLSGQSESLAADGVLEVAETWTYTTSYTVTAADITAGADLTNSVSVVTEEVPTPEVDSVDTPVEAVECSDIVISNVVTSTNPSGRVTCSLSFDVFSSDTTALTVTSITNTALSAGATVMYEAFPAVITDSMFTRVTWNGGFTTPECQNNFASDVVFTIEATCDGAIDPITVDFNLADIAAMA